MPPVLGAVYSPIYSLLESLLFSTHLMKAQLLEKLLFSTHLVKARLLEKLLFSTHLVKARLLDRLQLLDFEDFEVYKYLFQ